MKNILWQIKTRLHVIRFLLHIVQILFIENVKIMYLQFKWKVHMRFSVNVIGNHLPSHHGACQFLEDDIWIGLIKYQNGKALFFSTLHPKHNKFYSIFKRYIKLTTPNRRKKKTVPIKHFNHFSPHLVIHVKAYPQLAYSVISRTSQAHHKRQWKKEPVFSNFFGTLKSWRADQTQVCET